MNHYKCHVNLSDGINRFLSAVDEVLNSNTFLLTISEENDIKDLYEYLSHLIKGVLA